MRRTECEHKHMYGEEMRDRVVLASNVGVTKQKIEMNELSETWVRKVAGLRRAHLADRI